MEINLPLCGAKIRVLNSEEEPPRLKQAKTRVGPTSNACRNEPKYDSESSFIISV